MSPVVDGAGFGGGANGAALVVAGFASVLAGSDTVAGRGSARCIVDGDDDARPEDRRSRRAGCDLRMSLVSGLTSAGSVDDIVSNAGAYK